MEQKKMSIGTLLNAYPDSIGGKLSDIISLLKKEEFKDTFQSFYILPSVFNTDLDRGFSLIDYEISETLAGKNDINDLHDEQKYIAFLKEALKSGRKGNGNLIQ